MEKINSRPGLAFRRRRISCHIEFNPNITYFKPQGVPMRELEIVELTTEEIKAYRLRHINNLEQKEAAKKCALHKVLIKEFFTRLTKKLLML